MLESLCIKNYRNLKEFRIGSVNQINLITGKNNTGKTSLLEAIAIYAGRGDFQLLFQLLDNRGENFTQNRSTNDRTVLLRSLSAMFSGRGTDFTDEMTLFIGDTTKSDKYISFRFVKYFEEVQRNEQGVTFRNRQIFNDEADNDNDYQIGLHISSGEQQELIPVDRDRLYYRSRFEGFSGNDRFQFIRTATIDRDTNGRLFDTIALSEKEKFVIEALKIIEPTTERIAFIEVNPKERIAVIKLSNASEIIPLRSMGDGLNRVFSIILALVNADNGFLLLDEFENGIHHTVQEKLWKIIFNLSKSLNVQVFATTHSDDSISAFQRVLNSSDNSSRGKLIRLDNVNGNIKPAEYSPQELKIANDQDIETR